MGEGGGGGRVTTVLLYKANYPVIFFLILKYKTGVDQGFEVKGGISCKQGPQEP